CAREGPYDGYYDRYAMDYW
nr:immunoglobulin heavy chain junction region [Mus musculus]